MNSCAEAAPTVSGRLSKPSSNLDLIRHLVHQLAKSCRSKQNLAQPTSTPAARYPRYGAPEGEIKTIRRHRHLHLCHCGPDSLHETRLPAATSQKLVRPTASHYEFAQIANKSLRRNCRRQMVMPGERCATCGYTAAIRLEEAVSVLATSSTPDPEPGCPPRELDEAEPATSPKGLPVNTAGLSSPERGGIFLRRASRGSGIRLAIPARSRRLGTDIWGFHHF